MDEPVLLKMHQAVNDSTDKICISINHLCVHLVKSKRTTRSGKEVLTALFTALVYITSHENNARRIEVCCVETAAAEVGTQ